MLLLSCSMFVGSTFAWFTDSVVSENNIIKSGTLDVTMEWANGKEDPKSATTKWTDASTGAIFSNTLWEPGFTEVRHIRITNKGSLALKYQFTIVANGEVSSLVDVIDVYYADPAQTVSERNSLDELDKLGTLANVLANVNSTASGELEAGEEVMVTLALKMQETAGNAYQNLEIGSDFSVILTATQLDYENDSFGPDYDAEANYPEIELPVKTLIVSTSEEYFEALLDTTRPLIIEGADDFAIDIADQQHNIPGGITVKNITYNTSSRGGTYFISNTNDAELVFENCTFERHETGALIIASGQNGGDIVFNDCDFFGPVMPNAVDNADAVLAFNDCTFKITTDAIIYSGYVNCMGGVHNFVNCTFDYSGGSTMGSNQYVRWNAVNSYSENYSTNVVLEKCNFTNCGTQKFGSNSTLTIK